MRPPRMLAACLAVAAALLGPLAAQDKAVPTREATPAIQEEGLLRILDIRRVYVDRLTGGETAAQIRDMIINSLHAAKLFIITEDPERADAILRGSAEDLVYTDTYSYSEGLNARATVSSGSSSARSSSGGLRGYANVGAGENESARIAERKHEASAAVRLVSKDGDVIWSTTQESTGGKFLGSSADVADRIARKLAEDYERARKLRLSGRTSQ